jgi:hypothetical protein
MTPDTMAFLLSVDRREQRLQVIAVEVRRDPGQFLYLPGDLNAVVGTDNVGVAVSRHGGAPFEMPVKW